MNFFEHQDRSRRSTRRLILLFVLAVVAILVAVDLIVLAVVLAAEADAYGSSPGLEAVEQRWGLFLAITAGLAALIGIVSLFRTLSLRGGGGAIARQLGGTPVTAEDPDPLRRRLRNVVEEMAIASGTPAPEVYVLEREAGINAFAAGYAPSDAAVAVTRGTLEQLNRDQLQGVVAHEFSHILNGDMRLNIRLIGILFGILAMALVGRQGLRAVRHLDDGRAAVVIVAIGLAVMLIGYIGLLFGRLIKASVSRQREYLADASAVQFTRNPDGISGALKRIAVSGRSSHLDADPDEVSHMLFASGMSQRLFATHPPLVSRIQAIEPSFRPDQLEEVAAEMRRHAEARQAEAEAAAAEPERAAPPAAIPPLEPERVVEGIGRPGVAEVLVAGALAASLPRPIERAAHSAEWAPETLCYLLLDADPGLRDRQLGIVAEARGPESERQLRALLEAAPRLAAEQRLPLLEITFPALRRQPEAELEQLLALIDHLIHADGRVDPFEYTLARLTAVQVGDALHPHRTRVAGRVRLQDLRGEVADVLAIVARHGHADPGAAREAFEAGIASAFGHARAARSASTDVEARMPEIGDDWPDRLDAALEVLNELRPHHKGHLVRGLATLVLHAGGVVPAEHELVRAICASIHVPVLPLAWDVPASKNAGLEARALS